MEQMQIISKVDEPTEWCAGMVVVLKANGKVRICVNLTNLNESILREFHPLPSVDHTLAQLSGASVFSKLDANSVYHLSQQNLPLLSLHLGDSASTAYPLEYVQPLNISKSGSHKFWKELMVPFVRWMIF